MSTIIAYSIAFFSTFAFIILWFWVVRKELKIKRNILESAKLQLTASRAQLNRSRDNLETEKSKEIFQRSLDIYEQSVKLYNETLQKPWNAIPAVFLGFTPVERQKQ